MNATNYIRVGTEVCFFKGKGGRPVAYSDTGKVILCKNKIRTGYARLKTIEEKDRCFLVNADHIVKDIYSGIDYDDFIKVLPLHGYKIGFDHKFKDNTTGTMESHIYAYNLKTGVVILAETYTPHKIQIFNSIYVYLPNVSCHYFIRDPLFVSGNSTMTKLDLANAYQRYNLLTYIDLILSRHGSINTWPKDASLLLYNYSERKTNNINYYERLLEAPESLCLFKNCDFLKEIMRDAEIETLRKREEVE